VLLHTDEALLFKLHFTTPATPWLLSLVLFHFENTSLQHWIITILTGKLAGQS